MDGPIRLKFGAHYIPFSFTSRPDVYTIREPQQNVSEASFSARLEAVVRNSGLDLSRVALVVADKTRLCGYASYLPVLMRVLLEAGADSGGISVHIAYGTHARQSDAECAAAYGDAYGRYRFVHHDCTAKGRFVRVGETSRGTPVLLPRHIMDASCLITFGTISHHYFAGYGGGRKLVFPGLGFREAIYHNHALFLDARRRTLTASCRPGVLDGNPLADDLAEYESFRSADLAIHGIVDSEGRVCDLLPGRGTDHFRAACAAHAAHCEIGDTPQYDVVFASSGGYPKDVNFIQSHKAIHHAAPFVRDGGRLVILAQCSDGVGSKTFLPWFAGGWRAAFDELSRQYEGNGGTALSMMSKLERIQISVVTELSDSHARSIGFEKIAVEEARRIAAESNGRVAVIPNAGMLVRVESQRKPDGAGSSEPLSGA
jgi:lactate racemase